MDVGSLPNKARFVPIDVFHEIAADIPDVVDIGVEGCKYINTSGRCLQVLDVRILGPT